MTSVKIVILSLATVDAVAIFLAWFFTGNLLGGIWMVALCMLFASVEPAVNASIKWMAHRRRQQLLAALAKCIVPGYKYQGVD